MDNAGSVTWDISHFNQKKKAADFFDSLRNVFAVYSPGTSQIYTNYDVFWSSYNQGKLVVLPNQHAHHDTFFEIEQDATRASGIFVIPGEIIGRDELYVALPKTKGRKTKPLPAERGIELFARAYEKKYPGKSFVPIVTTGDLREFNKKAPLLHLHMLDVSRLVALSPFKKEDLKQSLVGRLENIRDVAFA
ncbi:hypothetical protein EOPP23_01395 [Endozoicomonas sp. OPT23]|uniref:hypothetical protein n=1 Tax=Endozoicomonas sp. OPT23 TaxID=2072845 RepID=UPI00129A3424|nr:hypothetical protein [Endozoicomonas sp. OPT23]MRI31648.1 hypothetical protein [Endozoicomonas sp. OPT23]